jgi:MinD superfamily P-loop ATPase
MHYRGCAKIVMPENYIALFDAPGVNATKKIIKAAGPSILEAANAIASDKAIKDQTAHKFSQFLSGPVNHGFNRFYVKADKFYAKDSCVSCGKCETVCPLDNISLYEGKPIWGKECTHCMACICHCPAEAIEYGKTSVGKRRYKCPV